MLLVVVSSFSLGWPLGQYLDDYDTRTMILNFWCMSKSESHSLRSNLEARFGTKLSNTASHDATFFQNMHAMLLAVFKML